MEYDIFSLAVGIQNPEDQAAADKAKKDYAELAVKVSIMTQSEGWQELLKEIAAFEKMHNLKPEFYSEDPKLAHIHTGVNYALKYVRDWADKANSFIKEQEYEQAQKQGE